MSNQPETSHERIQALVESFRARLGELRADATTEAQIRLEFLDPFWAALGWDVRNKSGKSDAQKDVVIEAHVATIEEGRTRSRRSDYLFRIEGFPRFFVEAKRPAVNLSLDKDSIFQAKTYAWNAQIPFAIATNFEQFRLYDATLKPYFDEPERGRIAEFDLRFEDYVAQWDVLLATFGRAAVASGSLEALLARIKRVRAGSRIRGFDRMLFDLRGTEPVDRVFLAHLEEYRLRFAREIYDKNRTIFPEADTRHGAARLTEAVGRLIDRLVFIRVCEDRGITRYGTLRDAVQQANSDRIELYGLITQQFREFDRAYNGYLFKAHFSEQLSVAGELLSTFIRSLYPPEAAYRFDVIGDDLLGVVYERFLGSTITVTSGHVEQEEKPEVRHAGGVYYTPKFIVDTIIRRVIGPKIAGKTPRECLEVTVLDPACGSGSFLIAAYQYLIDHCVTAITANPADAEIPATAKSRKKRRRIAFQSEDGQWHLMPDFKADLLTACLHGVDIDAQAVEVTIMSLYIKTMEGEAPEDTLGLRMLPDLDNNIRCGNTLISQGDFDDYWDAKHGSLFGGDEDVRFRINAFDWTSHTRGFGRLFDSRAGFDCIIGNPPYIRVQELKKWAPEECEFYKWKYESAARGNYDIYVAFLERGLQLLAADGLLGFICPHKFWQATYGKGIRKIIAAGRHLQSIVDFTDQQVFHGATTYTAVHVLSKRPNLSDLDYTRVNDLTDGEVQCEDIDAKLPVEFVNRFATKIPESEEAWLFLDQGERKWLNAVRADHPSLGEITTKIAQGIVSGCDAVFFLERHSKRFRSRATGDIHSLEAELLHPLLKGSVHVRRWMPDATNLVVLFPYVFKEGIWQLIPPREMARKYPQVFGYLMKCRDKLNARERGRFVGDEYYQFSRPQNFDVMRNSKILVPSIGSQAAYALDVEGKYFIVGSGGGGGGGYAIVPSIDVDLAYLCGVLNSPLLDRFLKTVTTRFHSGWYAYSASYLKQLPIKLPETAAEKKLADGIAQRVRRIIEAKTSLQTGTLATRERDRLERQIESDETRIDAAVLKLYGIESIPTA